MAMTTLRDCKFVNHYLCVTVPSSEIFATFCLVAVFSGTVHNNNAITIGVATELMVHRCRTVSRIQCTSFCVCGSYDKTVF